MSSSSSIELRAQSCGCNQARDTGASLSPEVGRSISTSARSLGPAPASVKQKRRRAAPPCPASRADARLIARKRRHDLQRDSRAVTPGALAVDQAAVARAQAAVARAIVESREPQPVLDLV